MPHPPATPVAPRMPSTHTAPLLTAVAAVAAVAVTACASGGSGPRSADHTGRESIAGGQAMVTLEPTIGAGRALAVPLPAARVWTLLPAAYEAVGLPLAQLETSALRLGSGPVRLQGRLGRTRLSDLIDCGTTAGGLRNADTHAVTLQAVTLVQPAAGDSTRSSITTTVVASGRPPSVSSGGSINCPSTGRLERRLAELLRDIATSAR